MSGCMMGVPRKQLYPQLMELPALTPATRARIGADARSRIDHANTAMSKAQEDYQSATRNEDTAGMAAAAARERIALGELESGTAALRALAEAKPPRQIAMTWFREQMNLVSPGDAENVSKPFGLSWFHAFSMVVVATFALTMLVLGVSRHRRSAALVNRLLEARPEASPALVGHGIPGPVLAPPNATEPATPSPAPALARTDTRWAGSMRVASIMRETPHVKTFRLVEPSGGPLPFNFQPGQFLTLSCMVGGHLVRRSYTIASPPTRIAYVEVTVKREDDGEMSRYLHDQATVGTLLDVLGPSGVFVFDGGGADSIVLIAGGVGITPMMCVIRYLTDRAWPGDIYLVFAARNTDELIFREELEYLQRRYPRLHVVAVVAVRSEGSAWMGLEGQITKESIAHAVPAIEKRRIHLCGPPAMMDAMRRVLAELDVPADQIKAEAFGPAVGLAPPPKQMPASEPSAAVASLIRSTDEGDAGAGTASLPGGVAGPATAIISFARSGRSAPLLPDKSVLEIAESIGVPIDYSCRVGTCGICKTKLLAGEVSMEVQDALNDEDKAAGLILACQARSLGNITIDA
ncbi:MAG: 2Fe-2S iron-sulfur cluster binding domain-containing protein [Proteobacteria bacterium]|nr:2Fe-2S iron-sulfur cluster binding domain-containing protein [Pseudomonadota bacterium]MCA0304607.1 2Fe-2S iron-sulfur cluster binding domain-containing protein [Pseudomonadota bacterium]